MKYKKEYYFSCVNSPWLQLHTASVSLNTLKGMFLVYMLCKGPLAIVQHMLQLSLCCQLLQPQNAHTLPPSTKTLDNRDLLQHILFYLFVGYLMVSYQL